MKDDMAKMMAKKEMLKMLKKMMMDDSAEPLKGKLQGMKKVEVVSDSEEGLEEGLSKAEQILKKRKEMLEHMSEMEGDELELPMSEHEEMMEEESEDEEEKYAFGGMKKKMKSC